MIVNRNVNWLLGTLVVLTVCGSVAVPQTAQNVVPKAAPKVAPKVVPIAAAQPLDEVERLLGASRQTSEERTAWRRELDENLAVLQAQERVVKLVAKLAAPSVVHIQSLTNVPSVRGPAHTSIEESGSGVIIQRGDGRFYVLTNRHVLRMAPARDIHIKLHDNRVIHPKEFWYDSETDIAILRVDEPDLVAARLGDSDRLEIGEFVLAMGSPFGLSQSVTFGIISAKGRRALDISESSAQIQDFIQTDAAINPGNSGGPLFNLRGEVIAINTAIASNSGGNEGIGFSIPIQMVTRVTDQLLEFGKVRRAYLGVDLDPNFTSAKAAMFGLDRPIGACVTDVYPGSPAAAANFSKKDVILVFNGVPVEDDKHLYNLVNLANVDEDISVTVLRGDRIYKIVLRLQER